MPKVTLRNSSLGEELFSSITHGIGVLLAILGVVLLFMKQSGDSYITIIALVIFSFALINLYLISTIYHGLAKNKAKKIFRVLDHCSIFLLIAGTYTPYILITLREESFLVSLILFLVVWGVSILGIVLDSVNLEKFKKFAIVFYLTTGWIIIVAFPYLLSSLAFGGVLLLLFGGIVYSLGVIVYGIGSKIKYFHSFWHFFVLIGSLLHYLSIYFYVI